MSAHALAFVSRRYCGGPVQKLLAFYIADGACDDGLNRFDVTSAALFCEVNERRVLSSLAVLKKRGILNDYFGVCDSNGCETVVACLDLVRWPS